MKVYLTFDAEHPGQRRCPPGNADRILDILAEREVEATFFLQGRWATAYPGTARRMAREHAVGSHGHWHVPYPLLTPAGRVEDFDAAAQAIRDTAGVHPRLFRYPNGTIPEDGPAHVGWDVFAADWTPDRTPQSIVTSVEEGVRAHGDGAIVLLHTWPEPTAEALPEVIDRLRAYDGVTFARLT